MATVTTTIAMVIAVKLNNVLPEPRAPSANTLSRVMGMINPVALQRSFIAWMKECYTLTDGEVIAIDGKTLRGSYDRSKGKGTIHMVKAFATANGMSIGQ